MPLKYESRYSVAKYSLDLGYDGPTANWINLWVQETSFSSMGVYIETLGTNVILSECYKYE
jgi:hypothetical protein